VRLWAAFAEPQNDLRRFRRTDAEGDAMIAEHFRGDDAAGALREGRSGEYQG